MVDGFFTAIPGSAGSPESPSALIVPHAGYVYSGQTAAYGYARIQNEDVETVVLVGPYHNAFFPGASVWTEGDWRTPLGIVKIDAALAQAVLSEDPSFGFNPAAHSTEHSLETQIPFLQRTLRDFRIVPILISDPSPKNTAALARAIWKHIRGKKVLVVASSDMSHYHSEDAAQRMDSSTLELLGKMDARGLRRGLDAGQNELCGRAAVEVLLELAALSGPTRIERLHYATSAASSGDRSRVVGYGALTFYPGVSKKDELILGLEDKKTLLRLARSSVEAHVSGQSLPEVPPGSSVFKEPRAVFVTIREQGMLRGRIGRVFPEEPMADAVRHMAVEAASQDTRKGKSFKR